MQQNRVPPAAGGPEQLRPTFNPYNTDAYDPLKDPASAHKAPLEWDDASNVNPQPTPDQPPTPEPPRH